MNHNCHKPTLGISSDAVTTFDRTIMAFPSLRGVPGTMPWRAEEFAHWASHVQSTAQRAAAQFILSVWHGESPQPAWWCQEPFQVGLFDPVGALRIWDLQHRAAFVRWCEEPFWPQSRRQLLEIDFED